MPFLLLGFLALTGTAHAEPSDSPESAERHAPLPGPDASGAPPLDAPTPPNTPPPPDASGHPDGPPPGSGGPASAPPVAGAAIRTMLREVGFETVTGDLQHPGPDPSSSRGDPNHPPHPPGVHRDQAHQGGGSAPGFLLLLTLPANSPMPIRLAVGGVEFRPNDAGQPPDQTGGDGTWTAMIERYPGGTEVIIYAADNELGRAPIEIRQTDDIPVMEVSLP